MMPFSEWSGHALLYFSLKCNTSVPDDQERTENEFKWSDAKRERFRSEIISCPLRFNRIVEDIDCNDRRSVNKAGNDFSGHNEISGRSFIF